MISNTFEHRRTQSGRQPYRQSQPHRAYDGPPRPLDQIHNTRQLDLPRKTFKFTRRENANGQLIRIEERRGNSHNMIIVPAEHAQEFMKALRQVMPQTESNPAC